VWGDVLHQSGAEAIKAGAVTATVQCSVRIRQRPGVTSGMRLEHGATVYNILAVLPQQGNPAYLLLPCEVTT
jgi:SPP1 family predicted phage head-tail adaptor